MSKVKEALLQRKKELEKEIKPLRELEKELQEVEMALKGIGGPTCEGCSSGCDICRTGWQYR